jgi:hypothetical protein
MNHSSQHGIGETGRQSARNQCFCPPASPRPEPLYTADNNLKTLSTLMTKIPSLDILLKSDDINASIIELDNFISELCEYGNDVTALSEPQRSFFFNQNFEREINNGGFSQYFFNSSGVNAHETVVSLKEIGALKTAQILQQAIDQFPDRQVPSDEEERRRVIDAIEEKSNKTWDELDDQFYEYADDLSALNFEFVKKHRDSF